MACRYGKPPWCLVPDVAAFFVGFVESWALGVSLRRFKHFGSWLSLFLVLVTLLMDVPCRLSCMEVLDADALIG